MRRLNTFFYGVGQGLRNIVRNRMFSLASIGTMAACLFLFGIFYIVLSNFRYMVLEAENNVGITIFFDEGISDEAIAEIGDKIRVRAEVSEVVFTSADQAWYDYRTNKLSPELAESFGNDNPLADSASYTVYLNDLAMQTTLVKYVESLAGVRKVNDTEEIATGLEGFNTMIAVISAGIIIILLMVSIFLIRMTISTGVNVRKKEISIMKLIGATDYFIRIPFVVEGILIGLIGAAIPLVVLRAGYLKVAEILSDEFQSVFSLVHFLDVHTVMKTLIPVSMAIGLGIGYIGSQLTLKKQLKKIEVGA